MSLKQFKLVTGEEIICNVVDDDDHDLVVTNALVLQLAKNDQDKYFYQFKPFMTYQDDSTSIMLLCSDKLIALANPHKDLVHQYEAALVELDNINNLNKQAEQLQDMIDLLDSDDNDTSTVIH